MDESSLAVRVQRLEHEIAEVRAMTMDLRTALGRWTMAIVIAMLGAAGTLGGAAVAYGELRQQARTTETLLTEVRGEMRTILREVSHDRP